MLTVEGLQAAYGDSRVLFGIDLSVARGEVVTLLGRNGMGKTTTVRSIFGLLRPRGGRVSINGRDLTAAAPHLVARAGLGLVPEGRQIFTPLTVEENLIATARTLPVWPVRVWRWVPVTGSQIRTVSSSPPVASQVPSGAIAIARRLPFVTEDGAARVVRQIAARLRELGVPPERGLRAAAVALGLD